VFRRAVSAAVAFLVLFHVWLLAGQVWDGRAFELAAAARWLIAAGLVAALVALRRAGQPVFAGRRAAAVWLVAALLHAPKAVERTGDLQPDVWIEVASVALGAAAGLGLAVLAGRAVRRTRRPIVSREARRARPVPVRAHVGFGVALAPRPPPLR
jgi:hypothetical protein